MKKTSLFILVLMLSLVFFSFSNAEQSCTVDDCGLRGWNLENGWQYVIMGWYPYEIDPAITKKNANDPEMYDPKTYSEDAKAPVLWQVLSVEDGKALLYTTYVIDAHQPTEVSDPKVADKKK